MSNNKQSSVEWLYNKMYEHRGNITIEEFEQAKAMHKEEIRQTYEKGYNDADFSYYEPEHYYTETFGGANEN
jgi:hypothetical protein